MIPRILITNTTWWPCASRLAMALIRSGCAVGVAYPRRGHPLDFTALVQDRFPYDTVRPLSSLSDAIQTFAPDLLVPGDDRALQHLYELHARHAGLRSLIERSLGPAASYGVAASRDRLLQIALEEGVVTPDFAPLRTEDELDAWCAAHSAPWVLKADGSWGGHGVKIVSDRRRARRFLRQMERPVTAPRMLKRALVERDGFWFRNWLSRTRSHVIAQQNIPGQPANCAAFAWKGEVAGLICLEVLQSQGPTGAATVVRLIDCPEMRLAAERIARRLELSGFFGLDFVIDRESGIPYLIEMNPRCTPACHLQLGGERDLVEALRSRFSGEPRRPLPPVTSNDSIAYFPQAWHWNRDSVLMKTSFHDVPWEDPGLIRELLRLPWPDRSLQARLWNRLCHTTIEHRASQTPYREQAPAPPSEHPHTPPRDPFRPSPIVLLQQGDRRDPLFLVHGVEAHLGHVQKLVRHLDPNQTVYGILSQALLRQGRPLTRVEDLAAFYIREIHALGLRGPYHLLGFSFGAFVSFEMARQLVEAGEPVGCVGMIDSRAMGPAAATLPARNSSYAPPQESALLRHLRHLWSRRGLRYAARKLGARGFRVAYTLLERLGRPIPQFLVRPYDLNWFAGVRYVPRYYPGKVTLFQARETAGGAKSLLDRWLTLAGGGVEAHQIEARHDNLFTPPQIALLGREVTACLARLESQKAASVAGTPLR